MSVRDTIRKHGAPKLDFVLLDGEKVYVRALSGKGRSLYTQKVDASKDSGGITPAQIATFGICEQDGTLAYDVENAEDLAELEGKDGDFLSRVGMKLFEISGLTVKAVETAAKNSEASPNDSSGSSSPATSSTAP